MLVLCKESPKFIGKNIDLLHWFTVKLYSIKVGGKNDSKVSGKKRVNMKLCFKLMIKNNPIIIFFFLKHTHNKGEGMKL